MTYRITFIKDMPSIGPAEVHFAQILDNGWLEVQWRDTMDQLSYYPPWTILTLQTPLDHYEPEEDIDAQLQPDEEG